MYKVICWDIDGTLVDTEELHYSCLKRVCENGGYKLESSIYDLAGLSLFDLWDKFKLQEHFLSKEEWLKQIHSLYESHINDNFVRDGIREVLATIKNLDILQVAVSNGERRVVQANLKNCNLTSFFQASISRDDIQLPKPAPEAYLSALELIQVKPEDAIAVEDSPTGVQAAKSAGIKVVAFPNQHTMKMDFSNADHIIDHPFELVDLIKNYAEENSHYRR